MAPKAIKAVAGDMENVNGTNSASVVTELMPGSIPPMIPRFKPTSIIRILPGSSVTNIPCKKYTSGQSTYNCRIKPFEFYPCVFRGKLPIYFGSKCIPLLLPILYFLTHYLHASYSS